MGLVGSTGVVIFITTSEGVERIRGRRRKGNGASAKWRQAIQMQMAWIVHCLEWRIEGMMLLLLLLVVDFGVVCAAVLFSQKSIFALHVSMSFLSPLHI